MTLSRDHEKNIPGTYVKKSPGASELSAQYIKEWDKKLLKMRKENQSAKPTTPAICLSRKHWVKALEIDELIKKGNLCGAPC